MNQEWLDSLEGEKRKKADELISKLKDINCPDPFIWAHSEIEENQPSLAEFRFLIFLKRDAIDFFDKNPEEYVSTLIKNGYPQFRSVFQKMIDSGIQPKEITDLLKLFVYEGIVDTLSRFEHNYNDNVKEYPDFVIAEADEEGNLTGRPMHGVYHNLWMLNPMN